MSIDAPHPPQRITVLRSSTLFRPVVLRFVGLVYAAACRQVHWERSAEDVTQAVLASLESPAPAIRKPVEIPAYLLLRTYREAFKVRKTEARELLEGGRPTHWSRAVETVPTSAAWMALAPQLDGVLACLSTKYRAALALHFIDHRPILEIADAFSTPPDRAQNLVDRALARLHDGLRHDQPCQPADFAALLRLHGKADAPPTLVARILGTPSAFPLDPSADATRPFSSGADAWLAVG